jgi:hypothetical protein
MDHPAFFEDFLASFFLGVLYRLDYSHEWDVVAWSGTGNCNIIKKLSKEISFLPCGHIFDSVVSAVFWRHVVLGENILFKFDIYPAVINFGLCTSQGFINLLHKMKIEVCASNEKH